MTVSGVTITDGRAAFARFLDLYDQVEIAGAALVAHYEAEGRERVAKGTLGQIAWIRSQHDGVLDGLLLPGGAYALGFSRMFADLQHVSVPGQRFEHACEALEDYWWEENLGLPQWDWQAGLPPSWAELAVAIPRLRADQGVTS
jgi:hypothetical protein